MPTFSILEKYPLLKNLTIPKYLNLPPVLSPGDPRHMGESWIVFRTIIIHQSLIGVGK